MNPFHLIAYDIADRRRLGQVHRFLKTRALAVQYSVFLTQCGEAALATIVAGLQARIRSDRDDVRIYRLPQPCQAEMLGRQILPANVFLAGPAPLAALQAPSTPVASGDGEILGEAAGNALDYNGLRPSAVRRMP